MGERGGGREGPHSRQLDHVLEPVHGQGRLVHLQHCTRELLADCRVRH